MTKNDQNNSPKLLNLLSKHLFHKNEPTNVQTTHEFVFPIFPHWSPIGAIQAGDPPIDAIGYKRINWKVGAKIGMEVWDGREVPHANLKLSFGLAGHLTAPNNSARHRERCSPIGENGKQLCDPLYFYFYGKYV